MVQFEKLQITKITPGEITKRVQDTCLHSPLLITACRYHAQSNWRVFYNFIDQYSVSGQFSEGYSIAVCMIMLLSNYPCLIFLILQLFIMLYFRKSVSSMDNITVLGENEVPKCRGENFAMVYVNYFTMQKYPSYKCGLSFSELCI